MIPEPEDDRHEHLAYLTPEPSDKHLDPVVYLSPGTTITYQNGYASIVPYNFLYHVI
jgi:hypothetical protein